MVRGMLLPLVGWTLLAGLALTLGSWLADMAGAPLHATVLAGTVVGMGLPLFLLARVHGAPIAVGVAPWRGLALALVLGVLLSVVSNALMLVLAQLVPWLAEAAEARAPFIHQVIAPDNPTLWPLVLLVVAFSPGVLEEAFFRGGLRELFIRQRAVWRVGAIALAFALLHGDMLGFVPLLLLGLVLGWMAERTGGWAMAAAAHVGHNAASIVAGWATWGEGGVDTLDGVALPPVVGVMVVGAVLVWWLTWWGFARWVPRPAASEVRGG